MVVVLMLMTQILQNAQRTEGLLLQFQSIVSGLKFHRGRWFTCILVFSGAFCVTSLFETVDEHWRESGY